MLAMLIPFGGGFLLFCRRFLDNARQIGSGNAQSVGIKFNVMRRAIIFHKQPAEVTIDCQCAFGVIG